MSVLDNLNKGAAGGGMQWMNRLLGFDETMGLTARPRLDLSTRTHMAASQSLNPTLKSHLAKVFAQYPIEVAHGDGVWLHSRDGRKILDFYGGHAVAGLGYGHPRWLAALSAQARQMAFQTNALPMVIRERAAARLSKFVGTGFRYGVLDQQRRRGQRERAEAGLQDHGPLQGCGAGTKLSRPHRRRRRLDLGRHGVNGMASRALPST
jgi:hypothetical protein